MPRKGKGVKRIIREEKRFREKKKQGKKFWRLDKGIKELGEEDVNR